MRQVPHYLIIGNGRVARHFQHYFSLLNIPFSFWHRGLPLTLLHEKLANCSPILVLINDDAIEQFIEENSKLTSATFIHFSGSLTSKHAYGAHPLMTFSHHFYTKEMYSTIYFIIDDDAPDFKKLMPGIPNPHARLSKKAKAKYHALCVLSGNFSCLLWHKLFYSFEHEIHLPLAAIHPYILQQTHNLIHHYQSALTGPLVRNDKKTIQKNLNALSDDAFQMIYQSFVSCYQLMLSEHV